MTVVPKRGPVPSRFPAKEDALAYVASSHPLLRRSEWRDLGGTWAFAFDPQGRWRVPGDVRYDRSIEVPYPPESQASGLHDTGPHPVVWYERTVHLSPEERPLAGRRLLLHFGAVDYAATVWVNGQHVTEHRGGHTPFTRT